MRPDARTGAQATAGGAAFDALALDYDEAFSATALGRALRRRVHEHLSVRFQAGQRWLDLGCGTGEDALWLASQGASLVLALDASPAMAAITRAKAGAQGWAPDRLRCEVLDLADPEALPALAEGTRFDGVLANFGVLNCLPEAGRLAASLASLLAPGGRFTAVPMGPTCLWEWVDAIASSRPRRISRRYVSRSFRTATGTSPLWYPTPRGLALALAPDLVPIGRPQPLGLLLPPTDAVAWLRSRPHLLDRLARIEASLTRAWPLAWLSDHYVMDFRARSGLTPAG